MKPIGGFFELEVPRCGKHLHPDAMPLTSGRACLALILRQTRPRRGLVPFYTCDSVLGVFAAAGVPVTFYALTEGLAPDLDNMPASDELLLYINYFALQDQAVERLLDDVTDRVVVDDAQAFFASRDPSGWSFNSARKFFGVPDGAYLRGPSLPAASFEPNAHVPIDHLVHRLTGHLDRAFDEYQKHEREMTGDVRGISRISQSLLAGVDYDAVAERRRRNFGVLHQRLGGLNRLPLQADAGSHVPFCYPLLPARPVTHEALWRAQVFAPRLWPEVIARSEPGFARERELAAALLPLPIDHRYDDQDMMRVAGVVEALA